ncbi:MAG TPA: DinB family protein [Candidatus Limnocylindrales bacterium]|nr:DinB family protein [Candidatus Limnocylindrales bacterium]
MKLIRGSLLVLSVVAVGLCASAVRAQEGGAQKMKTPAEAVLSSWNDIGNRLITMAEDWPEDKYTYRLTPQVRTFQEVLLHVAGSNYDLLNHVSGMKMGDGRNDPAVSDYKTKADTVAFLKKSVADGAAEIQKEGDAGVLKHLDYWIGYTGHMGEHYGLLVAYYRANGVVPPESRPKKK